MTFTLADFHVGDDVELHPATDAWMSGDRFGIVKRVGRKYVHVLMDRSDKTRRVTPGNIRQILDRKTR